MLSQIRTTVSCIRPCIVQSFAIIRTWANSFIRPTTSYVQFLRLICRWMMSIYTLCICICTLVTFTRIIWYIHVPINGKAFPDSCSAALDVLTLHKALDSPRPNSLLSKRHTTCYYDKFIYKARQKRLNHLIKTVYSSRYQNTCKAIVSYAMSKRSTPEMQRKWFVQSASVSRLRTPVLTTF